MMVNLLWLVTDDYFLMTLERSRGIVILILCAACNNL